jgi:hypothetical protein
LGLGLELGVELGVKLGVELSLELGLGGEITGRPQLLAHKIMVLVFIGP